MAGPSDTVPAPTLTVSRLIDAPVPLVFLAWTSQEHAARWWGPLGFAIESCRLDARPGGTYRVTMRSAEGTPRTKVGTYREIDPPHRLTFTYAWEDASGVAGHEMLITVTFQPQGDRTLLTLHQTGFNDIPERDSHREGWTGCFERFAAFAVVLSADLSPQDR